MSFSAKKNISQQEVEAAELTAIINSMPDAVYIGDPSGIKRCNRAALDMLGFDSVEELNQNIAILADKIKTRDAKTKKRLGTEEEPFFRAFQGEAIVREVLTTHIKNNKEIVVRCAAAPVWHEGRIIGAIAINSDITQEVNNKRDLEDLIEKLREKNQQLDKFVYTASHDLKSPLSTIEPLIATVIEEGNDRMEEEHLGMLQMALGKVHSMNELIHSLLESAASTKKTREWVDLNKVLRKVIQNLSLPAHIDIFIKHNLPEVCYHKISLMQIFQNLLDNAIKYCDKKHGTIKISCEEDSKKYILSISDNGRGIAREYLEEIFNRFTTAHSDPAIDSSGLGLSIVKEIIEENKGEIWAESEPGEGSTFYFSILKQ